MSNGVEIMGKQIQLCPFKKNFWGIGLLWYNDPEILTLTSDDLDPLTEYQFQTMIGTDLEDERSVVFGIQDREKAPIGIGMLRNIDSSNLGCDLHITIGEKGKWNQGYGSEAVGLMMDYAFCTLKLHKVTSTPFSHNLRMVRCLEKCGFHREGMLRDALLVNGQYIDVVIMGIINL